MEEELKNIQQKDMQNDKRETKPSIFKATQTKISEIPMDSTIYKCMEQLTTIETGVTDLIKSMRNFQRRKDICEPARNTSVTEENADAKNPLSIMAHSVGSNIYDSDIQGSFATN